jgi:glycosyltransferase involved in cell wall biosynthesis
MISIITCAYRPEEEVFKLLLRSVERLKWPEGIQVEYIIVDNAGGLKNLSYVQDFINHNTWTRIIEETKPGVTQARLGGLKESKGILLIFFDQDNEPAENYLVEAQKTFTRNPGLAVCGPGHVNVVFTGEAEPWVKKYAKEMMQELHMQQESYTKDALHFPYPPYGTGMIVTRTAMEKYKQHVDAGEFRVTDRSGSNLTSGGDLQIVFSASKQEYLVGRTPKLELNHLIPSSRSTFRYIRSFSYGNGLQTFPVVAQAYPDEVTPARNGFYENMLFMYQCCREFLQQTLLKRNRRMMICKIAALVAFKEGQFGFYDRKPPFLIATAKKLMHL